MIKNYHNHECCYTNEWCYSNELYHSSLMKLGVYYTYSSNGEVSEGSLYTKLILDRIVGFILVIESPLNKSWKVCHKWFHVIDIVLE